MPPSLEPVPNLADVTKRLTQRALTILENRLELLMVEVQQERERILLAVWLALGAAVFALLGGVALTVMVVVLLWEHSPFVALLILTGLYTTAALFFYRRLNQLQRDWQTLPDTIDQLRKDRECLVNNLH